MNKTVFDPKGKWSKSNVYDIIVYYRLCKEKNIGTIGSCIMLYIGSWCDRGNLTYSPKDTICFLSYTDIAKMCGVSKSMAVRIISQLLQNNLIERVNEDERQGTSKSGYKLNVSLIKKEKAKYLEENKKDRENG